MFRKIFTGSPIFINGLLPLIIKDNDNLSSDVKTVKDSQMNRNDTETGWDRIKMMFLIDELNTMSPELNAIYQASFFGLFAGAIYGGVNNSKVAYENFINSNQATSFRSHFDAKRKLQNAVTVSFAKGAFRWGWRLSLFTTSYVGITTLISVYRNKSSMVEYLCAGGVTGAVYKFNLGLRGIVIGGGLGTLLGGMAGGVSLLLLKLSGTTMEEVRYWQYKWKEEKDRIIKENYKQISEHNDDLLKAHDESLKITTNNLESIK